MWGYGEDELIDLVYDKGIHRVKLTNPKQFRLKFENKVQINPRDYRAWGNLGIIMTYLGNFKDALSCLKKSVELNNRFAPTLFFLRVVAEKVGDLNTVQHFDQELKDFHNFENRQKIMNPPFKEDVIQKINQIREIAEDLERRARSNQSLPDIRVLQDDLAAQRENIAFFQRQLNIFKEFHKDTGVNQKNVPLPPEIDNLEKTISSLQAEEENMSKLIALKQILDDPTRVGELEEKVTEFCKELADFEGQNITIPKPVSPHNTNMVRPPEVTPPEPRGYTATNNAFPPIFTPPSFMRMSPSAKVQAELKDAILKKCTFCQGLIKDGVCGFCGAKLCSNCSEMNWAVKTTCEHCGKSLP